ncbi:MAG: cupin [Prochloraceae cyanobacterium]|nr:cupin [Prochloraceae cyanobacterium]
MGDRDWIVTKDGQCTPCKSGREWDLLRENYRLYRFLTEVEDTVNDAEKQGEPPEIFLSQLRKLVRQLILNSYWIKTRKPEANYIAGTSILLLYEELGFPLTIQIEKMLPGHSSPIHNHGTWGIVAVLQGEQKNTFWQRNPTSEYQDKIAETGTKILQSGEIISFTTEAIHSIEAVGSNPTITLNLYGETDGSKRFMFDPIAHQAKNF